ncbi:ATP-binding protein [Porphyromonadaceae bacterium W3.11]|nr:ATP-binding protein [Porphyromonadaceae bacterium W3.11]MDN4753902.1 ATP-binding protein [Porphyromonadaceae bacterium W3.11]MDN4755006.1 ATP-binding protein [Porphyromonadaceae bacterium W3.11]
MNKELIRTKLKELVARLGSQRKAANHLAIGTTTVGDIIRGNRDEVISDEMWSSLFAKLCTKSDGWVEVETAAYQEICAVIKDSQDKSSCTWLVADAGAGKSTTARNYSARNANAVYVLCSEDMKRSDFLDACLSALGEKSVESGLRARLEFLIEVLRNKNNPVLILDEADKLIDSILLYCVTIYNHLEGHCGIVMLSTDYIEKRMNSGLRHNKRGYNELHSRIGRRFYVVDKTTPSDIYGICKANGILDDSTINSVIRDAEQFDFDLRRVKKCVLKLRA